MFPVEKEFSFRNFIQIYSFALGVGFTLLHPQCWWMSGATVKVSPTEQRWRDSGVETWLPCPDGIIVGERASGTV